MENEKLSWKNHGNIMEFQFWKLEGTLYCIHAIVNCYYATGMYKVSS